jgi:hypothetical protein
MDVLTAGALTIRQMGEQDCLVQLIEYLGYQRNERARKLRRLIEGSRKELQQDLKRNSRRLEKILKRAEEKPEDSDAMPMTMARSLQLSLELGSPRRLNRKNLHAYRLKVKELRDVLQLSERADDTEFLGKLSEVKDAIGEWHDWEKLVSVGAKLLEHRGCKLKAKLKATANMKYERALYLAHQLRDHYLKAKSSPYTTETVLSTPVLKATSVLGEPG